MQENKENNVESTDSHVDPFAMPNQYNTETEAFVETVGVRLFRVLVIALAVLLVGAAAYFILESICVLIVLVFSLLSLFGVTS